MNQPINRFKRVVETTVSRIFAMAAFILFAGMRSPMDAHAEVKKFYLRPAAEYFDSKPSLALLQAAMAGNLANAKALVAAGADPNEEGPKQNANASRLRLLQYAISSNSIQAVKVLMEVGADPELVAQHTGSAFLFAVSLNNVEMLGLLLDRRPIKSLSYDTLEDILMESIVHRHPRCMALLLERGAPVDFRDSSKDTLLMTAMSAENFALAEQLILRGASVNVDTPSGVTPAYQVQRMLTRHIPGSDTFLTLQRIKNLMIERGAVFPATDPKELRERRKANGAGHQP